MKHIVVISFSLLILGQAFVRTFWAIDYQVERAVYLKNCENKYRKDLECDGKCYLKKRMTAAETPQDSQAPVLPEAFRQIKDVSLFWEPVPTLTTLPALAGQPAVCWGVQELLSNPHLHPVFHPPA